MSATTFAMAWAIIGLLIWTLHRQWWHIRAVRRALWMVPTVVLAFLAGWAAASRAGFDDLAPVLATLAVLLVTASVALVIVLPVSGIVLTVERIVTWFARRSRRMRAGGAAIARTAPSDARSVSERQRPAASHVDADRRRFIATAAAALPVIAVGSAGAGVIGSNSATVFPEVPMRFAGLPAGLDGLRILHLSDIHLGYFVELSDLEKTLTEAAGKQFDLVLVTGDVADDLGVLADSLRMIADLKPHSGVYASIGNHEYYRGIEQVIRTFERGPVPLMIDAATTLRINGASLRLSAADDPAHSGRFNDPVFLRRSVERALDGSPSDAFHLLMSHRPEGFDIAAKHGVDLTLSGHYHGGIQIGWKGRAIIQPFRPQTYFWGHYRKGDSQLYTSGGLGHWFPFRLTCPPEAPIYVLEKAGSV